MGCLFFSFLLLFLFLSAHLRISGSSQHKRGQVDGGARCRRFFSMDFCIAFNLLGVDGEESEVQVGSTGGVNSNGAPHTTDGTGTLY